jgi:hypothetical protein
MATVNPANISPLVVTSASLVGEQSLLARARLERAPPGRETIPNPEKPIYRNQEFTGKTPAVSCPERAAGGPYPKDMGIVNRSEKTTSFISGSAIQKLANAPSPASYHQTKKEG